MNKVFLFCLLSLASLQGEEMYQIHDLGAVEVVDLNDRGEVAGSWGDLGFYYSVETGHRFFGYESDFACFPMAINNQGMIAGDMSANITIVFYYSPDIGLEDIYMNDEVVSTIPRGALFYGINDGGEILLAGWYGGLFIYHPEKGFRSLDVPRWVMAFNNKGQLLYDKALYDPESGLIEMTPAPPFNHWPSRTRQFLNNQGQVAGTRYVIIEPEAPWPLAIETAFIWDQEKGMRPLNPGTVNPEEVIALNDNGEITGIFETNRFSFTLDQKLRRAFFWSEEHGMVDLGVVDGISSHSTSINNHSQIVGYCINVEDEKVQQKAFLWDLQQGMRALESLVYMKRGWTSLDRAIKINNRGDILGYGTYRDETHAFLLTQFEED